MLKKLKSFHLNIYLIKIFSFSILINIYSFKLSFGKEYIILQSTTSTKNSGLYDYILPIFSNQNGIDVRVVAVGTGQAIKNAQNCDGDVLIVHSKESEENFVKSGFGLYRKDLMYNDFVIIGPENDPAKVKSSDNAIDAFEKIFNERVIFSSRGDESGTHKAEIRMWKNLNLNTNDFRGGWYRELGLGMGATLNVAVLPSSTVLPEILVMLQKSLPEAIGTEGSGPAGDLSSLTLKVALVPSSSVCPEILLTSKNSLSDAEGVGGTGGLGFASRATLNVAVLPSSSV